MSDPAKPFDVVIVGAGPGGIAAAVTAAEARRRVCLIDDNPFAGGQIWRNRGERSTSGQARGWFDRLEAVGESVSHLARSRVIARLDARTLLVETPTGPQSVRFESLVLATGARELFLPFPGWTRAGVFGVGGLQALVKQGFSVEGKRIVLAGTGPLLLAVATLLKAKGARVPLILEQTPTGRTVRFALSLGRSPGKLLQAISMRAKLVGTTYAGNSFITSVDRNGDGLTVKYRAGSREREIACDYLACGFNLIPNNELPQSLGCELSAGGFVRVDRELRTTVPNIYAVGEVTGVGGADKALLEGAIAAHSIVGNAAAIEPLVKRHQGAQRFADRLAATFALRSELFELAQSDTLICRCEDVTLQAVARASSQRDAKLQTRCGMGPCQGRVCGPIMQRLFNMESAQVRPPVMAASVGTLIAAAADQGGPVAEKI